MQAGPSTPTAQNALIDLLDEIVPDLAPERRDEARRLSDRLRNRRFRLALIGEFKRGKSTLGNALLGFPVLPVGVLPTTSVPILARWADAPSARVTLGSGEERAITVEDLETFSTEKANPENVRRVAFAEVGLPAPLLRSADLLDSPGTGSAHRHNTETALAALGDVDAAVVVLAADQPVGEAEIAFLKTLRRHVARFFFVVNRADVLAASEIEEVVAFVRRALDREGFPDPAVFPLSARAAVERRGDDAAFETFRRELDRFLREDREAAREAAARTVLRRLGSEEAFELRLAAGAARLEDEERRSRIGGLRDAVARIRERRGDRRAVLKSRFDRLLSAYDDGFALFRKQSLRGIPHEVAAAAAALESLPNRDYDRELRGIVESRSAERLREFVDDSSRSFADGLAGIAALVREESDELRDGVYRTLGEAFRLAAPAPAPKPDLPEGTRFDFSSVDVRCQLEATTDFLILRSPRRLARRLLRRRAEIQAEDFLERNGGRVRFELLRKGESFLHDAFAAAVESEDDLARRLERTVLTSRKADSPAEDRLRRLETLLERLGPA
jgi:hypothetical protein